MKHGVGIFVFTIIIINNNTNDNIYGAVIVAQSRCESSPGSCDEYGMVPSVCRPSDQAKRPGL